MRLLSVAVLLAPFSSSVVHAVPCEVGSLQSYIDLGDVGCTVEDKTVFGFLDFGVLAGGTPILATDVTVTPLQTPGNPGLVFDFGVTAGPGELLESLFAFSVTVLPGGLPIGSVSWAITGSDVSPDGANTALLCLGTNDPACPVLDPILLFDIGVVSLLADSRAFPPVATLQLVGDVVVDGGPFGQASLSTAVVRFHETMVPEPAVWLPIGAGLLMFRLIRGARGRQRKELEK